MSFRVWEDSQPQWIVNKTIEHKKGEKKKPEKIIKNCSDEDFNKILNGEKLGNYTHIKNTNIKKHEVKNSAGKVVSYTYSYTKTTTYRQCVHMRTQGWLGQYTTEMGEYTISGLYPGSYEIYEIGSDEYYDLELQNGYSTGTYHDVPNIRLAATATLAENTSKEVKLGLSSSATVHNDMTRGDLEITKNDAGGTPLDDIQIAIYGNVRQTVSGVEQHYEGWLTGEESYENVPWNNIGSIFSGSTNSIYTTEDGEISVTGLPVGIYSIYEIKTQSIEYALEGQGTFDGSKTLLGMCEITRNMESANLTLQYTQYKRPKGNLTIRKKGIYRNRNLASPDVTENLNKVQFILKSSAQDKGGWKEGEYVYITTNDQNEQIVDFTSDMDEATIFTTDVNGEVTISGLYTDLGPYTLIELGNDEQDQYYTDNIQITGDTTVNIGEGNNVANVLNLRTSGDLQITKVDDKYNDLKLQGAEFKLKLISSQYVGKSELWIGNDSSYEKIENGNIYNYYNATSDEYLVNTVEQATKFTTDANGVINIKKIINGTYEIYETKAPNGYDITKQDGYDGTTGMVYKGTVTISTDDNVVYYQVTNKKIVEKLSGMVWEDKIPSNKASNTYNHLYKDDSKDYPDKEDLPKKGVQVFLVDKNTGKKVAEAKNGTDENGYWEITKYDDGSDITYWDLAHSYIEYIYDNEAPNNNGKYGYVVANPFTGGVEKIDKNSKVQAIEIKNDELYDENLTGTKEPYPGRAVTYTEETTPGFSEILRQNYEVESRDKNTDLEHKLITAYYNNDKFIIENINLGLIQKPKPSYSVDESIAYVRVVKGGYTYTYKYGDKAKTVDNKVQSSIEFQNSSKTFTKAVYPSDIKYNLANDLVGKGKDDEINKYKIYVVYKIQIKNTTTENNIDIYKEQGLYLDENDNGLTNTYDTSRYTLETEFNKNEHTEGDANTQVITSDFARWSDNGNGTASFAIAGSNKKYDRQSGQGGIKPSEIESTYIEFRVRDEVLTNLIENGEDTNQAETSPSVVTTNAYHVYSRKDKNWKNKEIYTHETKRNKQSSGALFIKWQLMDTRTISGKAFEDSKVDDLNGTSHKDERIGNGQYDTGEKSLKDVVVSLINANDNGREDEKKGTVAYLYDENNQIQDETGKWRRAKTVAVTKVDENGNYTFKGVVPGEYYLKFTYGNGKVKFEDAKGKDLTNLLTNNSGKVETEIKDESKINSIYYKSTIVTGSAKDENNQWWFIGDIGKNKSIATDWMGTYYDKDENKIKYKDKEYYDMINARTKSDWESNYTTTQNKVVIDAKSPNMKIEFEYRGEVEFQTENNEIGELKTDCTEMNFGIMERPHVDIQLSKEIKNVKLTLQNGTTIINENPLSKNVPQELQGIEESVAAIERDTDSLYGAELTVTYRLLAQNKSEIDYISSDYYKYGDTENSQVATTTVTKIIDYLSDSKATYSKENESNVESILNEGQTVDSDKTKCDEGTYIGPKETRDYNNQKYAKKYIIAKNTTELTPEKVNSTKSIADYTLSVSKLMGSASSENSGLNSYSEIIGIRNAGFLTQYYSKSGNYKAGDTGVEDNSTKENDDAFSVLTVTPPTGKNKNMIVYVFIAGGLIALISGIVLIKKFVL